MERRKPKRERKEGFVVVRVSAHQKRLFAATAERAGLDVSGWLRSLGLREAENRGVTVAVEKEEE